MRRVWRRSGLRALGTAWALWTIAFPPCAAGQDAPRPYDLGVRVVAAEGVPVGDQIVTDLTQILVDELIVRGCFRSVRPVETDHRQAGQLVLKVRIDEVEKRTDHDLSLAASQLSDRPEDRLRYRVSVRVEAVAGLLAPGSDSAILTKPYRTAMSYQPRMEGEDPEFVLRGRLYDDFADRVASIACRTKANKLERLVREAAGTGD
jgi:hypothetical protein